MNQFEQFWFLIIAFFKIFSTTSSIYRTNWHKAILVINTVHKRITTHIWLASWEKGLKVKILTPLASGFTNIFSIQKYECYVFSMYITFSINIFVSYVLCTKIHFATLSWNFYYYQAISNRLWMHILNINIITYHKRYNLSLNTFVHSFFSKRNLIIYRENCQRNHAPCLTCYRYVHKRHRFLSTCYFAQQIPVCLSWKLCNAYWAN